MTDGEWELIRPLLLPKARVGRPRADDRMVTNCILYVLTTGCRWMDMPRKYHHYLTAWRRLKGWREKDVWSRILEVLISKGYSMGKLSLDEVAVDSTILEARKWGR